MSQRDNRDLPPFVYEPLLPSQIRLLMPTDDEDGLSWTLQVVTLDDELEFEALSYTWGAQDETFPITLNGRRHHVHRNLFTALPNIARRNTYRPRWVSVKNEEERSHDPTDHNQDMNGTISYASEDDSAGRDNQNEASFNNRVNYSSIHSTGDAEDNWMWEKASGHETMTATPLRPIWIDALCINQGDHEEKLVQLASMNRIYREAAMVWVCLEPPEDPDSVDQAIELLPTIVYASRFMWESPDMQYETNLKNNPHFPALERIDPKTLKVLKHLLGNR
ncbi:hypothetical protein C7974DRAFT_413450 [Boeremia exigua]|uniref:uncharacterized protein n=1 Tax=Boeremia exigua TaxID=749465 RepID=UPI001E8DDD6B|nr:uncharacterized protein C7974DRAFT_413450 [Boeremia exigua]KAH6629675.1 hypothetical protein C7974DRAFT_413450 [Boeremia exigua]